MVLAADVGATHVRLAVTDLAANVLASELVDLDVAVGPESVLRWVVGHGRRLVAAAGRQVADVAGVGIGLPGPVEHATGRPTNPPIMPGWDGFDVPGFVRDELGVVVIVDNDVNIMALGEHFIGFRDVDHLLFVKIATGIGSGIISDGALRRGAQGPPATSATSRCPTTSMPSAAAATWAASRRSPAGRRSPASCVPPASTPRRATTSWPWPEAGRVLANRLLRDAGRTIGEVLASAVSMLNPNVIVLGGTIAEAGDPLLAGVREIVYRRSLPLATAELRIVQASTGDLSGVVGAAVMVIDRVLAPDAVDEYIG